MRPVRLAIVCVLSIAIFATPASAYWSTSGTGSGSGTVVTMPAGLQPTATSSGQSVTVTWPQSGFGGSPLGTHAGGGYELTRYAGGGGSTPVTPNASCATTISGAGATLQCIETGVPYGTWRYAVTPVLNSLTGAESAKSTATNVVTAAPTLITATAKNPTTGQTTGDIDLAWGTVTGATGYNVYRRVSGGSFDYGAPRNGATPVTATTYGDAGATLTAATTYDYVVRAVAGSPAVESASSGSADAATISRPAAPASVTATAALAARVDVAWASVGGAVGYNVYRTSTGTYNYAAPENGGSLVTGTTFADITAINATTYRYVVRAVILGAGGARVESADSVQSGAVIADSVAPTAPGAPTVTNGHVLPAARCNIAAGTRFVNYASKAAVTVATTLAGPEAGATVVFTATTPGSTAVVGSAAAAATTAATLDLTSLVDGVVTLTAHSRDAAGNVSTATSMTAPVRKDVVFLPVLTIEYHSGILGLGARIDGYAECGADVVATKGSNVREATVAFGHTDWEIGVGGLLASSGWTATATDPAGNAAIPAAD